MESTDVLEEVKGVLVSTLGIEDRAGSLDASTPLLGSLPELDSMAVVELVTALAEHFAIDIDDDEITGDAFESLGSLTAFVQSQQSVSEHSAG